MLHCTTEPPLLTLEPVNLSPKSTLVVESSIEKLLAPIIRPAGRSDADRLFPLVEQFATSYRPDRAAFDRNFPLLLDADHADCVVAELGGALLGYALAFRLVTLYANGIVVELQELMVAPDHRGRGVGRRLVESIVERAQAAGAIEVTVPTRRAREYYLRLGFEETATYLKRVVSSESPLTPRPRAASAVARVEPA
jgi:GNAT superfamily N-acetyltransferase